MVDIVILMLVDIVILLMGIIEGMINMGYVQRRIHHQANLFIINIIPKAVLLHYNLEIIN